MSDVVRARLVLACVLLLVGVAVVVVVRLVAGDGEDLGGATTGAGAGGAELADPSGSFTIAGNATEPISPGVMVPFDLELTNPHGATLSVTDLSVSVREVSAPNADAVHPCEVGDFAVTQSAGDIEVTVEAGATRALSSTGLARTEWPQVGMVDRPTNQDGCKGATLVLAYTASGTLDR
ncbi:hypothetical protein [Promicromonospora soli]|uniref:Uncharacterized protein n=1 Tax=Promicromonospora soli TaxID=2035533 RepID=A0A919L0D6_9MICO|nr:hypothetical protein [Promicromonospora soli]GHH78056.1 hypothetical protein GCM10017772_40690 [Promicromonospora soli]